MMAFSFVNLVSIELLASLIEGVIIIDSIMLFISLYLSTLSDALLLFLRLIDNYLVRLMKYISNVLGFIWALK